MNQYPIILSTYDSIRNCYGTIYYLRVNYKNVPYELFYQNNMYNIYYIIIFVI